uniref:Uncharacterized protein n=1 Tax=Ditylenchus dipsaci TaxID=166011 RepID=A0A915CPC0_9BILA
MPCLNKTRLYQCNVHNLDGSLKQWHDLDSTLFHSAGVSFHCELFGVLLELKRLHKAIKQEHGQNRAAELELCLAPFPVLELSKCMSTFATILAGALLVATFEFLVH